MTVSSAGFFVPGAEKRRPALIPAPKTRKARRQSLGTRFSRILLGRPLLSRAQAAAMELLHVLCRAPCAEPGRSHDLFRSYFFFSFFNCRFSFGLSLAFFCCSFLPLSFLPVSPMSVSPRLKVNCAGLSRPNPVFGRRG